MKIFLEKNVKYIIIVIIVFVGVSVYKKYYNINVKDNYLITKGRLINFFIVGVEDNRYLEYKYSVKEHTYTRKVFVYSHQFDCCHNNLKSCTNKEFWVIYSHSHPNMSLIDLTEEIQGIDNPKFPETLDNFK